MTEIDRTDAKATDAQKAVHPDKSPSVDVDWKVDQLLVELTNNPPAKVCSAIEKVLADVPLQNHSGILETTDGIYSKAFTYSTGMNEVQIKAAEKIQAAVLRDNNEHKEVTFFNPPMELNQIKVKGDDGKFVTAFHEIYDPANKVVLEANKCP